jgi:hypothetical protein
MAEAVEMLYTSLSARREQPATQYPQQKAHIEADNKSSRTAHPQWKTVYYRPEPVGALNSTIPTNTENGRN